MDESGGSPTVGRPSGQHRRFVMNLREKLKKAEEIVDLEIEVAQVRVPRRPASNGSGGGRSARVAAKPRRLRHAAWREMVHSVALRPRQSVPLRSTRPGGRLRRGVVCGAFWLTPPLQIAAH
jgi:hypothetical protein